MALTTTNNAINSRISTLTVSSAQLLDLLANPVTIVNAPGSGNVIIPTKFVFSSHFNTTAYTITFAQPVVRYQGSANSIVIFSDDLVTAPQSVISIATLDGDYSIEDTTDVLNSPIILSINVSNLTLGNGTVTIQCFYDILPISV